MNENNKQCFVSCFYCSVHLWYLSWASVRTRWAVFFKTWHTHSSGVHMCSCCRRISGLADSEEVLNTLLRVRTRTEKGSPQQLIRTSAHSYRTHRLSASRTGRHVVYAGARSEAAQEPPGGKSLAACPLVRRGDIRGGGEDAVRRGSAPRTSP